MPYISSPPSANITVCYVDRARGRYSVLFTGNCKFGPAGEEWVFHADDKVQDFFRKEL